MARPENRIHAPRPAVSRSLLAEIMKRNPLSDSFVQAARASCMFAPRPVGMSPLKGGWELGPQSPSRDWDVERPHREKGLQNGAHCGRLQDCREMFLRNVPSWVARDARTTAVLPNVAPMGKFPPPRARGRTVVPGADQARFHRQAQKHSEALRVRKSQSTRNSQNQEGGGEVDFGDGGQFCSAVKDRPVALLRISLILGFGAAGAHFPIEASDGEGAGGQGPPGEGIPGPWTFGIRGT